MSPPAGKPVVLVVTSTLPRWDGDTEPRFVLDLCRALAGDYRIVALAPHCRGAARREELEGVEVRRFRYFPEWGEVLAYEGGMLPKLRRRPWLWALVPFFVAALVLAVARSLRRDAFDLVHAHWLIPQGAAVLLARTLSGRRVPVVCTAHGADVFALRGRLAQALQRWTARGCARLGVVSEALRRELERRGVGRARLCLLPMGVACAPPASSMARRDPNLIAFAGRIVEKKGVDVLLAAFALLSAERPELRLRIAGGGPELDRYRAQADAAGLDGRAVFEGPVPHEHVRRLFEQAAVAVMPSLTARDGDAEGLGLVMLEAMAASCPVVVTDLPAVRDVLRPGENGLVFPERDVPGLAAALRRLLTDRALAAALAARARRDVEERFSWPAVAARHRAAYREISAAAEVPA